MVAHDFLGAGQARHESRTRLVIALTAAMMVAEIAAGTLPKGRSAAAQAALANLVDEAKQSGVVEKAIEAKGLKGVNVATQ